MALLPPDFLDAVVAIGQRSSDGKVAWVASGFLYDRFTHTDAVSGMDIYRSYLVTNRHVLRGVAKMVLRFNPTKDERAMELDVPLDPPGEGTSWFGHPNPAIDVAVMPVQLLLLDQRGIRYNLFVSNKNALDRQAAITAGLLEGDPVYVLGFPMGRVGEGRNYPLVRQGVIARIRDWFSGSSSEFIVDAQVFPGNSGGPVVTKPELDAIEPTLPIDVAALIGVVQGYVPYSDVAVSAQTGNVRVVFEENSGLTAVVPLDYVNETIDQAVVEHPDAPAHADLRQGPSEGATRP